MRVLFTGLVAVSVYSLIAISTPARATDKTARKTARNTADRIAGQTADATKRNEFKGFVSLSTGHDLYVDYVAPQDGQPTLVLLNGLTYRIGCWDAFVGSLGEQGYGVLRYDMLGQGETLLKYAPIAAPIAVDAQLADLSALLVSLGINKPVHFIGLSYGGALGIAFAALHPETVASVILMSPFVAPLPAQDSLIKTEISQTRVMYPFNPATDNDLYEYFLHLLVYSTYPEVEPIVLENPYKLEATYQLAVGSRYFLASQYASRLPAGKVHLMIAGKDQYVPIAQHEEFWNEVPASAKASRVLIEGSEHKIPEAVPGFAAAWVRLIVNGDPRLSGDAEFDAQPDKGIATSGHQVISGL